MGNVRVSPLRKSRRTATFVPSTRVSFRSFLLPTNSTVRPSFITTASTSFFVAVATSSAAAFIRLLHFLAGYPLFRVSRLPVFDAGMMTQDATHVNQDVDQGFTGRATRRQAVREAPYTQWSEGRRRACLYGPGAV